MSDYSDCVVALAGLDSQGKCPTAVQLLAALGVTPNTVTQGPCDSFGFAKLSGITNPDYKDLWICNKQIAASNPIDTFARGCADVNVFHANGLVPGQMIGCEGVLVDETVDPASGKLSFAEHQPHQLIPTHFVWPPIVWKGFDLATNEGCVAYINQLAPRQTGSGAGFGATKP